MGTYLDSVQNHGPGADERIIMDNAALEVRVVANDAPVPNNSVEVSGAVNDRAVLDRRLRTHDDRAVIPPQNRTWPH